MNAVHYFEGKKQSARTLGKTTTKTINVNTEDNAVFISSLPDPNVEHLVNLLIKSPLPRSITRGVGLLELFPRSFWGEEQFVLSWFLGRNSSEISLSG